MKKKNDIRIERIWSYTQSMWVRVLFLWSSRKETSNKVYDKGK